MKRKTIPFPHLQISETQSPSEEGVEVSFKFKPKDYIKVTMLGLNYNGRVAWCEYNGQNIYGVEYSDDQGKLERRTFNEDELEKRDV